MKTGITCMLLILISTICVFAEKTANAAPPLALDGVGRGVGCGSRFAGYCATQLLSASRGADIIILIVQCGPGECPLTISILDTSGLSFTERVSYTPTSTITTSPVPILREYYARATSPLNSDNITVVFFDSGVHGPGHYGIGHYGIQALAVHGVNPREIFDPNLSIPAVVPCDGIHGTTTCSATVETTTMDLVIASTVLNDASPCGGNVGLVPGFTTIVGGGSMEVDYLRMNMARSNVQFTCNNTEPIVVVLDAISLRSAFGTS